MVFVLHLKPKPVWIVTWLEFHIHDAILHIPDHLFVLVNLCSRLASLLSQLGNVSIHCVFSLQEAVHVLFLDGEAIMVLAKLVDLVVNFAFDKDFVVGGASIPAQANSLGTFLAFQLAVVKIERSVVKIYGGKRWIQELGSVGSARRVKDNWQVLEDGCLDLHDIVRVNPEFERFAVKAFLVHPDGQSRRCDGGAERQRLSSKRMIELGKTYDERVKVDTVKGA